ncbi:MAG: putative RNA methyltransferase, partial [Actinomycetota bacterium]
MWTDRAPLLACPICGGSLRAAGGSLACAKSHSFDLARSGYVNLLPARKKISASVGDSRAMLEARERFLSTGHFAPLAEAVERLVVEALGHRRRRSSPHEGAIVEVGAGTGYYIARMKDRLDALPGISYFGIDVSKEAVRLGARRHTDIGFVLADVKRRIPLGDH